MQITKTNSYFFFYRCIVFKCAYTTNTKLDIVNTAVKLVEQQLDAYNKVDDIDAFLMPYAEQVEIYTFPNKLQYTGKAEMRKR